MRYSTTQEYTVVDTETGNFSLVTAESQKEAVLKALERDGYLAERTDHARPRTGDEELMSEDEYQNWLDENIYKS